jgi:predicted negative regulator of RcsB-dependent stress response
MKSERRHELEQNELADWLAKTIESSKPYQNTILGVILLMVLGFAGYTWWTRHSSAESSEAWGQFNAGLDAALNRNDLVKLGEVADKYPSSRVGECAAVVLGDMHLYRGCDLLFQDKGTANDELRKAVQQYTPVHDRGSDPMLRERATFGLARAREASNELDQARQLYGEIDKKWPDGTYAAEAKRRLADLNKESTKTWYDKFAKYDPKPAFSEEPGTPGKRPSFNPDDSLREDGSVFDRPNKSKLAPKPESPKGITVEPGTKKPDSEPDKPGPATTPEKPAAPESEKPAMPESEKPAMPETEKPAAPSDEK